MKILSSIGKQKVIEIFQKQNLLVHFGATLKRIEHGQVDVFLPKHDLALQHHGYFHGGVISYLADVSAGLSGCSLLTDMGQSCLTVEMKINFLSPANGSFLIGKGKVLKETRSLIVTTSEIFSEDKLCAFLLQTIKKVSPQHKHS